MTKVEVRLICAFQESSVSIPMFCVKSLSLLSFLGNWDLEENHHMSSSSVVPEIVGEYPAAVISFEGGRLVGRWKVRPPFSGELDPDSTTTGQVTFPDDQTIRFEYSEEKQTIFWGGTWSRRRWVKTRPDASALGIAGEFMFTVVSIQNSRFIQGYWKRESARPDFYGSETGENSGSCTFPDDRTYTFEYDSSSRTIYWESRDSGNLWRKV